MPTWVSPRRLVRRSTSAGEAWSCEKGPLVAGMTPGSGRWVAGRYRILGELGRGGMGVVWLAADDLIGRQVALKELRSPAGLSAEERDVFARRALAEARNAARIHHPNAVVLHDAISANEQDDAAYLVMEYVPAPSLDKVIRAEGRLSEGRVTAIALQLLDVLDAAHALGVVHRDVKPANILLAEGDVVKLTDFGIAHRVTDPRITRTGLVVGTPAYLAPELVRDGPISAAADLWSLGAVLFHAATGTSPFERADVAGTLSAILVEQIPAPSCHQPLAGAIAALLVREPQQRATSDQVRSILGLGVANVRGATAVMPTLDFGATRAPTNTRADAGEAPLPARRTGSSAFALASLAATAIVAGGLTVGLIASSHHGHPTSASTPPSSPTSNSPEPPPSATFASTSPSPSAVPTTPQPAAQGLLATGWHYFTNNATSDCLDQDYSGGTPHADVLSYPCNHDTNESWNVMLNDDGTYSLTNAATGECLNQDYYGGSPHAQVIAYPCGPNQNQNWRAVEINGSIFLQNEQSGYCLDQDYSGNVAHTDVIAYSPCNFAANEGWTEE